MENLGLSRSGYMSPLVLVVLILRMSRGKFKYGISIWEARYVFFLFVHVANTSTCHGRTVDAASGLPGRNSPPTCRMDSAQTEVLKGTCHYVPWGPHEV